MKKKILSNPFLVVVLGIILLFLAVLSIDSFVVKNRIDTKSDGIRFETMGRVKKVEIKPAHNLFNIVILQMKNPGLENHEDFIFRIFDDSGNIIRSINYNGQNIGDPSDIRFQFEPLVDSSAKTYRVEVSRADSGDEQIVKVNVDKSGNLSFTSYCRTGDKIQNAKEIILLILKKFTKDFGFIIFWGLLLTLILLKGYRLK